MYSVLSKRTNIWHSTIFCSSGRLSANWLFYPISLVARQLPMSSTNKSWWVIWNAKRLPNMTQNSRKLTILLAFWAVPFVFTMGLEKKTHTFQAWIPETQTLKATQSWVAHLRVSLWLKVLVNWWQLDRFVEIYGEPWMELTEALRRPIPGQTDTALILLLPVFALT